MILPLAGFAASQGNEPVGGLLWTTTARWSGALALYGVGALLGRDRSAIAARLPLVKVSDIDRTEAGSPARHQGGVLRPDDPLFRSMTRTRRASNGCRCPCSSH